MSKVHALVCLTLAIAIGVRLAQLPTGLFLPIVGGAVALAFLAGSWQWV